jgi:EAL domain-containing protein (putative c-di-GMP-specific phosphodiesterase class I)
VHGEVLLRMIDDDGKLISPARFFAPAERFQIASRIDRWVVRKVFDFLTMYRDRCAHLATVSINLSGQSVGDRDFHRYAHNLMEAMAIDAYKICFEITQRRSSSPCARAACASRSMISAAVYRPSVT